MGLAGRSFLMSQIGYQIPALLVYLVAFILALAFMSRATIPCVLTLAGVAVLVVGTLGLTLVQASLFDSRQASGRPAADFAWLMSLTALAGSCVRAVGLGFLVAAIFVGRRAPVIDGAKPGAASDW
jgi:hypothetical protein